MKFRVFSVIALSFVSVSAFADLTAEQMAAAQTDASSVYPFNKLTSSSLKGDVVVVGGNGTISDCVDSDCKTLKNTRRVDFKYNQDKKKWPAGEYRYDVSEMTLDTPSAVTDTVKACIIAQAKEVERLNQVLPGADKVFKGLSFDEIEAYDNKYYKPIEDASYASETSIGSVYYGSYPNYNLSIENSILVKVALHVHLERANPCDIISAETLAKKLTDGRGIYMGNSAVKLNPRIN